MKTANEPIKSIISFMIVLTFVPADGIFSATAQTMSTNEAKVVVVVDTGDNTIQSLVLFTDSEIEEERLQQKYSDCKFYIGLMEGSYEVVQTMVRPQTGTTIIVFNNQPIFGDNDMVFTEYYNPGDLIKIGKKLARVVSNNKGELILSIQ